MDMSLYGLPPEIAQFIPYALGVLAALILLLIFWNIWRSVVNRKVRGIGTGAGMRIQDLDGMRKKGMLTEEEFKQVRRAMANRELKSLEERQRVERERAIFQEMEINPEAARKLLADAEARKQGAEAAGQDRKSVV